MDREIADFKAEKEKDYIAFEQKLRAEGPDNYSQQESLTLSEGKDVEKRRQDLHEQHRWNQGKESDARKPSGSLGGPLFHEREVEFQGLFTPSYLPLLDSAANRKKNEAHKPSLTLSIKPNVLAEHIPDSTPTLSSATPVSASTTSSSASLHTPGHTESRVPREISLSHRRSSSRSDTSITSLRSSLRNPTQPHSPKRVLFSIDNVVVSPSTSPLAQRSSSAPQAKPPVFENPQGSAKVAASKNRESYYGVSARNRADPYSQSTNPSRIPSFHLAEGSSLKYAPTYRPRDHARSSALAGGDDFEGVGSGDDLFAFDEDMDLGELEHTPKDVGNMGSDEEEDDIKDTNPSSSPHAGSLPIEIRWPQNHRPRK